jgi:small-conductance mechanosensitive channel
MLGMALLGDPWFAWLLVAAVAVVSWLLIWLLMRAWARLAAKTEGRFDDKLVHALRGPLAALVACVAAASATVAVAGRLTAGELATTRSTLLAAFILVGAWVFGGALRMGLDAAGRRKERLLPATRIARRLVAVVLYTGAFLVVLQQYGIAITPILTGLGIAGLAAALALQDTLGNFFSGISIQTGRALQPGHFVRLESQKLEGYVEEIGWRSTSIRMLSGNTVFIPNATLAQAVVTDYYLPDKVYSVGLDFLVGHEHDPRHIMAILVEEAKESMKANDGYAPGSEPYANFAGIEEYALRIGLSVKVREVVQQYQVQNDLRLRILERFHKEGIRMPYPTRHNYQEVVGQPKAGRAAGGLGGVAPKRARPSRPRKKEAAPEPTRDPRLEEAERARADIAAKQEADKAKEEAKATGEPRPEAKPTEAEQAAASAAVTDPEPPPAV